MKMANDDKVSSRYFQLPLGFNKTDPGDLKRVMAFLDDRSSAELPVLLSEVFSRFSEQSDAWSGARIARTISSLFSDRMISCVVNGNASLYYHSSIFLEAPDQWERIQVIPRKRLESCEMEAIVDACQKIFGMDCPSDQDDLIHFLGVCLKQWESLLASFSNLAETRQYPGAKDIRSCLFFIQVWLAKSDPYEKICAVRDMESALSSFSRKFIQLKGFYENWIVRWEFWRRSIEQFIEFQSEIEDDPEAAAALSRLRHVLEKQNPWDDLNCMDDLITQIKPVYERIRDERFTLLQRDMLLKIDQMIETISGSLENVHARYDVRNKALFELQKIKKAIESERPNSLIFKHWEIAEEAFENAQDIVLSQS